MDMETSSKVNFVPCVKWVRRGVAKANPEKVQLSKEELLQVINQTKCKLEKRNSESSSQDAEYSQRTPSFSEASADEFNFEKYDDEEGGTLGIDSLAELPDDENFTDSDSEKEDDIIKPSDNLILIGRIEGDVSVLEVFVYNEEEESLYVHHDLYLPSYPLCLEWLDYEPGQGNAGSLCAVGSMSPIIEVWDLDIMNCLEAAFKLGRSASRKKHQKQAGHTDAVLDLAWNKSFHHILASASVDKTILLWDLDEGAPNSVLEVFEDKVQCLKWHHLEAQTLLAGSSDKTARVFDCRSSDSHQTWTLSGEGERVIWNPLQPFTFLAGTDTGQIQCFDCRKGELWSLSAHEKEVTGLTLSNHCPGLLISTSADGYLKTWDYSDNLEPIVVNSRDLKMGMIHCLEMCPDLPFVIAAGGENKNNNLTVLDLQNIDEVLQRFGSRKLVQLVPEHDTSEPKETTSNGNS